MKLAVAAALCMTVAACARSSVLPMTADVIQITTSAAPACGAQGAQKVALRRAAIETLNRGFDRFIILGAQAENSVRVVGTTPIVANTYGNMSMNTYGNYGTGTLNSTTTYTGGTPIIAGTHDQGLMVKMFREGDPLGANAISAKATLGPDWQELLKQSENTTC